MTDQAENVPLKLPNADIVCCNDETQWLEERKNYITASDIAAILGQHPRRSALALYSEKIGLLEADDLSGNSFVEWGKRLEPIIASKYSEVTGRDLLDPGRFTLLRSKKHPWLAATLDRMILPALARPAGALEIKNTNAYLAKDWQEEPPISAQIQLQCQLLVTGLSTGSIAALIGGNTFFWIDQQFNAGFAQLVIEKSEEFMERLKTGNPPEADSSESTREAIKRLYPRDTGATVALPGEAIDWASSLEDVKAQLKALESQKDLYENKIKLAMGDASTGVLPDGTGFSYKAQTRPEHTVNESTFRVLRRTKK